MTPFLTIAVVCLAAPPAPEAVPRPLADGEAQWVDGFWAERYRSCLQGTLPSMSVLMEGTKQNFFLEHFRIAAGESAGKHHGPPWNDGDTYKWIEALAAAYAVTRDTALDQRMDAAIAIIAKAQRDDGYLHTPVLIAHRNGNQGPQPFQDRLNFEMYNFGHLFTAAAVHHGATGKRSLLEVAVKAADFLDRTFRNPTADQARNNVCPSHLMGLIDLARATGEVKYRSLASAMFQLRDRVVGGTDDNQDRIPFRQQTEAVGHAVRANYLYAGAADLIRETGDETLRAPLESIWTNMATKKMYLTGACGALFDGASPDGIREQTQIGRVHQSYGRDYQLPHSTAHNETCAAIGNVLWNERMLRLTGDAKYAEVMETALLNAVLAGVSLDGTKYFYTNTLRQLDPMPVPLRWSRQRDEWISCFCCPPNVARTVAHSPTFAYGRSAGGLWCHTYGSSRLRTKLPDGQVIALRQATEYPWNGRITLTLDEVPSGECSLFLRIPSWAEGATVSDRGQARQAKPGRYYEIRRRWTAGDVVELHLPMNVRFVEANPLVEEAKNQVALQRGPLVYCLESTDLPRDTKLNDAVISLTRKPTAVFDAKLLGGVAVLETTLPFPANRTWGTTLYREATVPASRDVTARFIPYFAWANRGPSEMTVWLNRGP